jgi:dihydrofolate synthase/folylpolyglutamate synthase
MGAMEPGRFSFPSVEAAFAYLESFANFERQTPMREAYRLDRMAAMLDDFGNPQLEIPAIHIAGSKGKGSTAHYCAALLAACGQRVGLYTSPHVFDWRERICRPEGFFADADYVGVINSIRDYVQRLHSRDDWSHGDPTTFELLTLAAYLLFRQASIDWMVIETGLGGLLDATNLMRPAACLITALELEHTDILGDTIEEIAAQKAGIFKPGAILLAQEPVHDGDRIAPVLERAALQQNGHVEWVRCGFDHAQAWNKDPNQNLAVHALTRLAERLNFGWPQEASLRDSLINHALTRVRLPARLEWYAGPQGRRLLLDGAHTVDSIARALAIFQPQASDVLLFGSVAGKNHPAMAALLAPLFKRIIITTPGSFKKSDPQAVLEAFLYHNPHAELATAPDFALGQALASAGGTGRVMVCGSFYLAGAIQPALKQAGFQSSALEY